jgi:predicted ferric reductase
MQPATTYRQSMRTGFYVAVIISLFILFLGWWFGSMNSILNMNDRVMAIGRLFGLLAGWSVVMEIILMSRVPFIERAFDLQEISDLHRLNGYALLIAISGHFGYQLIGYAQTAHLSWWAQFLAFNSYQYEDVLWATIGTLIFFGAGAISVRMIRSKMRYEWWYVIHMTIYFGILLTFLHQIKLGGDFIANFWFAAYWYALYILAFVVWAWYRVVRQFALFAKHQFKVMSIEKTATNTYSIVLTGKNLREFEYEAGQYATWRFMTPSLWYEAHPFSFSSSPGMEVLRFTVKASPDLTQRLLRLKPGSLVMVDGPRGNFTADRAAETPNAVLIAGGIGITPFLSNIRQLLHDGKNVSLLYAVRTPEDVAFSDELRQLQAYGLKINFFVDSAGQRITNDVLSQVAREDTTVYICGPDGMSKALVKNLKQLGISSKNIVTERFAY